MEILVFSDSHGRRSAFREVVERQPRRVSAVFFLGDGLRDLDEDDLGGAMLAAVCGNCDWSLTPFSRTETVTELEGHRILATHGHLFGVKGGLGALIARAAEVDADIVLFGHTHRPHAEVIPAGSVIGERQLSRPMLLFNPGSLREGSFGILTLQNGAVLPSHGEL